MLNILKKTILALAVLLLSGFFAAAQSKLSAYSLAYLHRQTTERHHSASKLFPRATTSQKQKTIGAFITLNDESDFPALEAHGASIANRFGTLVTARIVMDSIIAISQLPQVKYVDIERNIPLNNATSREMTKVNAVHNGTGIPSACFGKNVIIGIIDSGIEFNHINFRDDEGKSRVKRVHTLRGDYSTPEEIALLTTDYTLMSHGTHTAGTAAGSYSANGYQGMAPQAELVLCGLDSMLTDVNIINSCKYVFDYAKSVGKPAVVNMSLADQIGPHDGTSGECIAFESMQNDGNIIVLSSSNYGGHKQYISKTFTNADSSTPQLQTMLNSRYAAGYAYEDAYIDIWSRTDTPFGFQIAVVDSENNIVHSSPVFTPAAGGSTWDIGNGDTEYQKYYGKFEVIATGGLSQNGKYNVLLQFNCLENGFFGHHAAIILYGKQGETIDMWSDGPTSLISNGSSNFTDGNDSCSISNMATGENTISVGAYRSQSSFPAAQGSWFNYDKELEGDIAPFSSYGIDMNGIPHPDVCGPGFGVGSSVNSYDTSLDQGNVISTVADAGKTYYWGLNAGTSMSAPAVSGIIALWLSANPSLSTDDVKRIIRQTAIRDNFVISGNQVQWGAGKINAQAGIMSVLNTGVNEVGAQQGVFFVNADHATGGSFDIYLQGAAGQATVSIFSLDGTLAYSQNTPFDNGRSHIDTQNRLATGIYVLKVVNGSSSHATRIIIK